jgi:putative ABC transport system ATP-binding protein
MERLEIEHLASRSVTESSLGEQQRAAVARAMVAAPMLLLADEPSSHQDVDRLHLVWSLFHEAAHNGAAVLAASHDRDAEPYCDRILELRAGRRTGP